MPINEIFDNINITGSTPSTFTTFEGDTLSADTIYLGGMDITELSGVTYQVRTSSGFTEIGYLEAVIQDSLEIDTISGLMHLKGDVETPTGGQVYGTDVFGNRGWFDVTFSGLTGGESNTGQNIGSQIELFEGKSGVNLRFRTLSAGTGIQISQEASAVTISSSVNAPGGISSNIQYNNAGSFDGENDFVYVSGKVGIGTATPTATLDVEGDFLLTGSCTISSLTGNTTHPSGYKGIFIDPSTGTLYANEPSTGDTYVATGNTHGIEPGLNMYTGGTIQQPILGLLTDISLTTVTTDIISAATFVLSGSNIVDVIKQEYLGVFTASSLDLSAITVGQLTVSGNTALADTYSSGSISATTYISGTTDLYDIFLTQASNPDIRVQPGLNTYTGGTATNPTVNLSSATLQDLTITGSCIPTTITFPSGMGDKISLYQGYNYGIGMQSSLLQIHTDEVNDRVGIGWGSSSAFNEVLTVRDSGVGIRTTSPTTDLDVVGGISATTLSANTICSGSTNIDTLFSHSGHTHKTNQGFAISDETTAITSAATAVLTYYAPFTMTIDKVFACLSTSGSTSTTFDIHLTGTTIFSTKPTIDANEFTTKTAETAAVITATTITEGDKVEFFIDVAGTNAKGAKLFIDGYRA